jgi:lipopolysaccharide/colanic/teichoic acid biosynthesis glycosyltransferase
MSWWLVARDPLDRAVAAVVGVTLVPLVGLLAALARGTTPGPAIVRLRRIGRHGRPFMLLKLRTMRTARNDGTAGGGELTAGRDDRRITRLGRYLRASRLDELPQLLHVLTGTMAVIGPRPETPAYVDQDDPRWQAVLRVRPGIAGPTQALVHDWEEHLLADAPPGDDVYGDLVLPLKLAVDEWYVRNASPLADLVVIASLVERFVLGRTVTWAHRWFGRRVPALEEVSGALTVRPGKRASQAAAESPWSDSPTREKSPTRGRFRRRAPSARSSPWRQRRGQPTRT